MNNTELNNCFSNDTVFNEINKKFVSLKDNDVKRINTYLQKIIDVLIKHMKLIDPLFKIMYQQIFFCGSFYKGTKVGTPNEFDLNIILQLPVNYNCINFHSTRPAFVQINIGDDLNVYNTKKYINLPMKEKSSFQRLISDGYVDQNKFRQWIEGIITKVLNISPNLPNGNEFTEINDDFFSNVYIKVRKSGPAFTLILDIPYEREEIHIDLAPALSFNISVIQEYTTNFQYLQECRNRTWFAIPAPSSIIDRCTDQNLDWRFSFFLQENEILARNGRMKPVIRQMKKLRDIQNWKGIASYYIETLFLNQMTELQTDLNKLPLTLFLFIMLKELCYACMQHELKYFWNNEYNLLEKISELEMMNIGCRLNNILRNIEYNAMTDPFVLAKYVLTPVELGLLKVDLQENLKDITTIENNDSNYTYEQKIAVELPQRRRSYCIIL